jgi:hypothetical protein
MVALGPVRQCVVMFREVRKVLRRILTFGRVNRCIARLCVAK